ncbi:MAG: SDR family NAD(P)-dependent oxidoreductase [Halobacteriaceae archaeon]
MEYSFPSGAALITGAASGIGRAAAAAMSRSDLTVVGVDIATDPGDDTKRFEDVVEDGELLEGDVTDPEDVSRAVRRAEASGPIQAVVTCAGIGSRGGPGTVDRGDLRAAFAVHVEGTYEVVRRVLPGMRERGEGAIVTTSSIAAAQGWRKTTDYAPAKGGIEALTRQLAAEVSPDGVRVNAVSPGFVRTGMNADVWARDREADHEDRVDLSTAKERTLLPGVGEPQDVGRVIAFLASEEAGFITGQVLPVDGGWTVNAW